MVKSCVPGCERDSVCTYGNACRCPPNQRETNNSADTADLADGSNQDEGIPQSISENTLE